MGDWALGWRAQKGIILLDVGEGCRCPHRNHLRRLFAFIEVLPWVRGLTRVKQQGAAAHQAAAQDSRPNRRAAKPNEKQAGEKGSDHVADATGNEQGFDADAFRAQARDLHFEMRVVADHNVH
jgi:hypothetical protein